MVRLEWCAWSGAPEVVHLKLYRRIDAGLNHTTWQVSRKGRGLARAPRALNPYLCVVNLRTLPSRVYGFSI